MTDTSPLPDHIVVTFDRLTGGTLVAVHESVAAIVHPRRILHPNDPMPPLRWCLAGEEWATDVPPDTPDRPHGDAQDVRTACAEAAKALGEHVGRSVVGWEVAP